MALTGPRAIPRRSTYFFEADAPVKASAVLWQGALCGINNSGFLDKAAAATTFKNFCVVDADNGKRSVTGGAADGDVQARIFYGVFPFKSGGGGDALTQADLGKTVYAIDDETVGKTDGTGTRSACGKLDRIDTDGYWVSLPRP